MHMRIHASAANFHMTKHDPLASSSAHTHARPNSCGPVCSAAWLVVQGDLSTRGRMAADVRRVSRVRRFGGARAVVDGDGRGACRKAEGGGACTARRRRRSSSSSVPCVRGRRRACKRWRRRRGRTVADAGVSVPRLGVLCREDTRRRCAATHQRDKEPAGGAIARQPRPRQPVHSPTVAVAAAVPVADSLTVAVPVAFSVTVAVAAAVPVAFSVTVAVAAAVPVAFSVTVADAAADSVAFSVTVADAAADSVAFSVTVADAAADSVTVDAAAAVPAADAVPELAGKLPFFCSHVSVPGMNMS
eukprot:360072-Chlamydomonas_euryale.AAC.1